MGKSKPSRRVRKNPISRPTKPPSDPELLAIRDTKVLPILKNLQSTDPKARSVAASAVANAITNEKVRKLFLREQLVRIVMQETLTDASVDSKASGWEILKILAEEEDAGFLVHLFRVDILTAIEFACKTILETLESKDPPFITATKAQKSLVWRISRALTSLLTSLAEASEEVWNAIISNQTINNFLLTLVSRESTEPNTADEVMTALMTLTEDNKEMCEKILATEGAFSLLMKLKELDGASSVLACGVLHNIFEAMEWNDLSPGKDDATDKDLVCRLARTLQDYSDLEKPIEGQEWNAPDEVVKLVLEILASISTHVLSTFEGPRAEGPGGGEEGAGDDKMDEDSDSEIEDPKEIDVELSGEEDNEDGDSLDEEAMMEDLAAVTGADEVNGINDLPTLEALLNKVTPQTTRLAALPTDSEEHIRVKSHAISALNNLAWSISCLDFTSGQNAGILAAWTPVAIHIWEQAVISTLSVDTADIELATNVTSLAWALARVLKEKVPYGGSEHEKFIALYQVTRQVDETKKKEEAKADPFTGLGVKCIGVLGQMAINAPIPRNKAIGLLFLDIIKKLPVTPAVDAVEALNQLFDIYGDENAECDKEVFWKENFVQVLEEASLKVKTMLKGIHKKDPAMAELRGRAEEAVMNLTRFISYKKKHVPKV